MKEILMLILGLFVGGFTGVATMCLLQINLSDKDDIGEDDDYDEEKY